MFKADIVPSFLHNGKYMNNSSSRTMPPISRQFEVKDDKHLDRINEDDSRIGEWLAIEEASLEQINLEYRGPQPEDLRNKEVSQQACP